MKNYITVFILLLLCLNRLNAQNELPENRIIVYDGTAVIFPAAWLGGKIKAKATAPDSAKMHTDTTAILEGMYKYPASLLEKELGNVYLVGRLRFSRQYFTGTNSEDDIYIGSDQNKDIEKTFHHEFSSILLRNHGDMMLEAKWKEISPELLSGSSAAAVREGLYAVSFDPKLLEKGYLSPYSLSNWENDFNMYAENIFAGGAAFWKLADSYPKVMAKVKLVIQFYAKQLWSGFTEYYFRFAAE